MGHQHQRRPVPVAQPEQELHDRCAGGAVEIAGGLVRQQHLGPHHRRARQRHALLLAARHLRRVMVHPRAEAHRLQLLRRPLEGIRRARKLQGGCHVLQSRHGGDQVERLEHHPHMIAAEARQRVFAHRGQVAPERGDLAPGGAFEPAHEHEERRFARSRRPREPQRFAAFHREVDALEDVDRAGIAHQREARVFKRQDRLGHRANLPSSLVPIWALAARVSKAAIAFIFLALPAMAEPVTLLAIGDSLTQGYGLPAKLGFVPQLETWLNENGAEVTVVNGGVSGDTSAGGASRIGWALDPRVDAVMVTLGGNDLLRGIDPAETKANLDTILGEIAAEGLPALLVGMTALGNYGEAYAEAFNAIYPALAEAHDVPLFEISSPGSRRWATARRCCSDYILPDARPPERGRRGADRRGDRADGAGAGHARPG